MLDASLVLFEVHNLNISLSVRHCINAYNIAIGLDCAIAPRDQVILARVMNCPVFAVDKDVIRALSAIVPDLSILLCSFVFRKESPHRRVSKKVCAILGLRFIL
jgi:hypothetical protein